MIALILALACAQPLPEDDGPMATADAVLVGWHHDDSQYPEPGSGARGSGRCWYLVEGFALAIDYSVQASTTPDLVGADYEPPESEVVSAQGVTSPRTVEVLSAAFPVELLVYAPWAEEPSDTEEVWTVEAGNRDGVWWAVTDTGDERYDEAFPLVPGCPVEDEVEDYELSWEHWSAIGYAAE